MTWTVTDRPPAATKLLGTAAGPGLARRLGRLALAAADLTKVRLNSLVLLTVVLGFHLADPSAGIGPLLAAGVGAALAAFGACALNELLEVERDRAMSRTRARPLVTGEVSRRAAFGLGVGLMAAGCATLAAGAGPLPAALAAASGLVYVLAYTPLKRRTPWCVPVGAVSGALPPAIGWAAATGEVGPGGWALAAVVFVWQVPHFLAIDWVHRADYARGGFRMPSTLDASGRTSARLAVLGAVALVGVSLLPPLTALGGAGYGLVAVGAGGWFLAATVGFLRRPGDASARRVFRASLVYLPVLLLALALATRLS